MKIKGGAEALLKMLVRQLKNLTTFEDSKQDVYELENAICNAISKLEHSLMASNIRQTKDKQGTVFSPYHAGQYAQFLYWVARSLYIRNPDSQICDMVSALNGYLHSLFLNHRVNMPSIFYLDHPYGTIIGRATIGEFFFAIQGVTVGAGTIARDQVFPQIGNHVTMLADSSVMGNVRIGNRVIISAGSRIVNQDIPDNCIVFGQSPELTIKLVGEISIEKRMSEIWRY